MSDWREDFTKLEEMYRSIPGGKELVAYLGETPSFHDGEVLSLELNRSHPCFLKVHGFSVDHIGMKLDWKNARHALVTLKLESVIDLQLDGFSSQNVIGGLNIEKIPPPAERDRMLSSENAKCDDYEITLEPCYGLDGRIRCKGISISFEAGIPHGSIYQDVK